MTIQVRPMTKGELAGLAPDERAGLGALATERGNLPLDEIDVRAQLTGLTAHTELSQSFVNPHDEPLEATYIFPLPDRAAVTGMRMEAAGRVIEGVLKEREQARQEYDAAIAAGQRASIAEEERPDVFTMRVGNIMPGERVVVRLTLAGVLPYEDGAATYRLPLVVAPRYIPGAPLDDAVGAGVSPDTDAVPDASRITPPVLLPGFPYPVRLGIEVRVDPAGLPLRDLRCSLHEVAVEQADRATVVRLKPGERANRDFVLRLDLAAEDSGADGVAESLALTPDGDRERGGTFQLTLAPPPLPETARPRDVVLVLDRSGSMAGWKMTAARRAAARIVDTLSSTDRFAVLGFDNVIERPPQAGEGLVEASDRGRFQAVEFLVGLHARGGTEMLAPLREALSLLEREERRDRVLVLVTDGQVGNEDQILREVAEPLSDVRVHTVGIDQAVNAGFLGRLAAAGAGRCELVESEDRLDEAMDRIHRRIASPLVTGLRLAYEGLDVEPGSVTPARLPDLYQGAPLRIMGRYRAAAAGGASTTVTVSGARPDGELWQTRVNAELSDNPALAAVWARGRLRDLEDRYTASGATAGLGAEQDERQALEREIVETSLRYGVLCRFTAYVAVDSRVLNQGGAPRQVIQPVEAPAGWQMLAAATPLSGAPPAPGAPAGAQYGAMSRGFVPAMLRLPARGRESAESDPLDAAREQIRVEASRLATAEHADEAVQRAALADLGSRLRALVRDLLEQGAIDAVRSPLVDLARRLAECDDPRPPRGEALRSLWRLAAEVLQRFLDSGPSRKASPPEAPDQSGRRRTAFWKR